MAGPLSEVLLAIVRPCALLFGKVIGVGIVGVDTLLCAVLPVVVKLALGLGAVLVVLRVGSNIYARAIVRAGRRLKLIEMLRSS